MRFKETGRAEWVAGVLAWVAANPECTLVVQSPRRDRPEKEEPSSFIIRDELVQCGRKEEEGKR